MDQFQKNLSSSYPSIMYLLPSRVSVMFSQPNVVANGNLIKSENHCVRSAVLLIKLAMLLIVT